jgi:deazaflavin-dependent oxidoreductase (nitroreductase family)
MPIDGEYQPSSWDWVAKQVEEYEASGGTRANTLRDTGRPVIIFTYRGQRTGKVRKSALMRVEDGGRYALVASVGGAPKHPSWYFSVKASPEVLIQDGPEPKEFTVREVEGEERDEWWRRAVAAYPPYEEYQQRTSRRIPVLVAEPKAG